MAVRSATPTRREPPVIRLVQPKFGRRDWDLLEQYRFDPAAADDLVRRRHGVYIDAVCSTDAGSWGEINTNSPADPASFTGTLAPLDHDREATEGRMACPTANRTPAIPHRSNA